MTIYSTAVMTSVVHSHFGSTMALCQKTHGVINKFVNTEYRSLVKVIVSVRRHGAI